MTNHRVIPNVFSDSVKRISITYPNLREPLLPNRCKEPQFPSRPERESTLDKLNCALDGYSGINCQQKMKMIWHDHELV